MVDPLGVIHEYVLIDTHYATLSLPLRVTGEGGERREREDSGSDFHNQRTRKGKRRDTDSPTKTNNPTRGQGTHTGWI